MCSFFDIFFFSEVNNSYFVFFFLTFQITVFVLQQRRNEDIVVQIRLV